MPEKTSWNFSLREASDVICELDILTLDGSEPPNAGHQRRARTAAGDKPCMKDMLIARPLHGFVRRRV